MTDTLYGIWGSTLTGIANSIRAKNPNVSGLVDPADMEQDILDIPSGGGGETEVSKVKIVSALPSTVVDGTVYLVPQMQILPAIPDDTGLIKFIITANLDNALNNYDNATEFYLMCSDLGLHTCFVGEEANVNQLIFTNSTGVLDSDKNKPPSKIYKYTVGGSLQWVEIDAGTFWASDVYRRLTNVIYASETITQRRSGDFRYSTASNIVGSDGKATNLYKVIQYKVYYANNGTTNLGNHDLKWVVANFR